MPGFGGVCVCAKLEPTKATTKNIVEANFFMVLSSRLSWLFRRAAANKQTPGVIAVFGGLRRNGDGAAKEPAIRDGPKVKGGTSHIPTLA